AGEAFTISGFRSLYSGWVVNGDEIVAYGSVSRNDPTPGFQLGLVRLNVAKRTSSLILPFKDNSFYLLNQQYLAVSNGQAYFVAMGDKAVIYRVPFEGRPIPLKTMPMLYSKVPKLRSNFVGPTAISQQFGQLESLRLTAGLYGYEGFLYLLVRDPCACSPWSLYKIDPRADRLIGSVPLPTFARHLALVPGDQAWLLIEKGPVAAAG